MHVKCACFEIEKKNSQYHSDPFFLKMPNDDIHFLKIYTIEYFKCY